MTVDAIYFDLDETLYDYLRYAESGLGSAGDYLEAQTGRRFHAELYDIYFEDEITEGTFDVLLERYDLDSELTSELIEAFHDATGPLEPYPETEPVLLELAETHRLGLITDGRGGHAKLRRLGLEEYFGTVLVTPTIGRSKRDPVVFERALSALSVPPGDAMYVGDDPRIDFRVPNELGMTTVRLRQGRYTHLEPDESDAAPDREIRSLDDLLALVAVATPDQSPAKNR